ncbi:hypothetical protein [Nannocystis pusilla]|uniref:hypothetical protein n=1 Tax=Nannocystis pusilla TaxID=889268 RepID=UPI003B81F686
MTLIALTAGVWAMVSFVAWAVVSLPTAAVDATDVQQCDPRRPDEEQCPDGQWCVHGECTPQEEPQVAQRGEQCRDCPCDVGLRCGADLRCRPPSEPEAPAPTCGDPVVEKAVSQLTQACLKRRTSVQDRVEGGEGCSADEWRALLADDDQMNALLGAFPDRLVVYFPERAPRAPALARSGRAPTSSASSRATPRPCARPRCCSSSAARAPTATPTTITRWPCGGSTRSNGSSTRRSAATSRASAARVRC